MDDLENETELLDYDETEEATAEVVADKKKDVKGSYVSIHSSGFRDFLLKESYLSLCQSFLRLKLNIYHGIIVVSHSICNFESLNCYVQLLTVVLSILPKFKTNVFHKL